MDVERISGREMLFENGQDLICVWLSEAELNRLRFDASIATTVAPGRYPALDEFLDAGDGT